MSALSLSRKITYPASTCKYHIPLKKHLSDQKVKILLTSKPEILISLPISTPTIQLNLNIISALFKPIQPPKSGPFIPPHQALKSYHIPFTESPFEDFLEFSLVVIFSPQIYKVFMLPAPQIDPDRFVFP